MKELRLSLPNELWDKFACFSPKKMREAIALSVCLLYGVSPEENKRKKVVPKHNIRGSKGTFERANKVLPELKFAHSAEVGHLIRRKSAGCSD